ncbi:sensor histidine kinase [Parvularcula lutaonensis]|uniref:histidine kinase n=1 Tax=Parvularcula lutaonensis TaxID=491923 RepID=A0ABV7MBG2_9PROT|nr:HAMP domain-containing sensor histidine kinase [Parvularcula lutaonensis]GGY46847.1 sensor histidine kinase [Parvularcula lutaonensis]
MGATLTQPADRPAPIRTTRLKRSRFSRSRFSGALLIGNTLGLILLTFGALGLMAYRDGLLDARLELVERQAVLARAAVSENGLGSCGSRSCLRDPLAALVVMEEAAAGFDGRVALYAVDGGVASFVAETTDKNGGAPVAVPIPEKLPSGAMHQVMGRSLSEWVEHFLFELPIRERISDLDRDAEAERIARGLGGAPKALRRKQDGTLVASVSLPVVEDGQLRGVLIAESDRIDVVSHRVRKAMLPIAFLTFGLASFSALTLTAAVSRPLRQLAYAAEKVRSSVGRAGQVRIPDFDQRRDEVGRLSRAFRAMTQALVDRIESIDSFAADVSHELKNPLTSIKSAIETMDKCKTDEQRARLLEVIANDVERMDRLISDISSASRLDAQLATETREVISLAKLIGDIVGSYRAVTSAGGPQVNFWDDLEGEDSRVFAAPAALGRVIRNLIDNAVSFSPQNAAVSVALEKSRQARQHCVLVTVTDEGPGVPPENLESIFDRFYTTSRPEGATFGSNSGLGLAIARQIVESHGGRIWAENVSVENGGARFCVEIPLHRSPAR